MSIDLPRSIRELLKHRIDSFDKLELVIALHAAPRGTMSVDELSRTLKLPRESIRKTAIELRTAALVGLTLTGDVQLLPPTEGDRTDVAELVRLYEEDRLVIVKALGEIAMQRIRNMASTAFADAFIIRKKRKDDDG